MLRKSFAPLALLVTLSACAPNPQQKLTAYQRSRDMGWLFSKIEGQYAPLEYKQKLHHFDYEQIKQKYEAAALEDQTNEDFYRLLLSLIAEFRDGHMSGSLTRSALPGRSKVVYLGFVGRRKGENFIVQKFAPTFASDSHYPIKVGDEILEFNGLSLREAVKKELQNVRNIGQEESNFTAFINSLFLRSSLSHPLPQQGFAKIKFKRDSKIIETEVPWITKDYYDFAKEQSEAAAKKAAQVGINLEQETKSVAGLLQGPLMSRFMTEGVVRSLVMKAKNGNDLSIAALSRASSQTPWNTFEFQRSNMLEDLIEFYSILEDKLGRKSETSIFDELIKERFVPEKILPINAAKTFPAYITTFTKDKKRYSLGYIRINTFSPASDEDVVINEFRETLKTFRDFGEKGVNKIVLDLLDNGGGSLRLGLKMAQMLSRKTIDLPLIKVRLNDNWMDSFHASAISSSTDAEEQIARTAYNLTLEAAQRGERLSPEIGAKSLYPFELNPNSDLEIEGEEFKFEIVALVNEMCASMCDIFSSTLKDNNMAKILGKQTMGAGGNVVQHASAPSSGLIVNLTESLVLSPKGEYLENNGVKPDITIEVTQSSDSKYENVIRKAFETLVTNN
jgi:hypothetical protein